MNSDTTVSTIKETAAHDTKVVVLNTHISSVSGTKNVNLEKDLKIENIAFAGKKVLELQLYEESFLKKYHKLWRDADALVKAKGGKSELGYIYRRATAVQVVKKLYEYEIQWNSYKEKDAAIYEEMCERSAASFVKESLAKGTSKEDSYRLSNIILENQHTWEYLDKQLQFGSSLIQLSLNVEDFDDELYEAQANGISLIRDSVMGNMILEVVKTAQSIKTSMSKRELTHNGKNPLCVNNRTLTTISDLVAKLKELSFIHKNLGVIADEIQKYLSQLPVGKALRFHDYENFKAMIGALTNQIELTEKLSAKLPLIEIEFKTIGSNQSILKSVKSEETTDHSEVSLDEVIDAIEDPKVVADVPAEAQLLGESFEDEDYVTLF